MTWSCKTEEQESVARKGASDSGVGVLPYMVWFGFNTILPEMDS